MRHSRKLEEFLVSHNNENQENEIEIDFDKKQFLIDLLASFEKEDGPDDISSLLDLSPIESFKLIVVSQLKGKFKDKDEIIINYFNKNLRPTLEFIARQDKELTNYMDIQTRVLKGLRITRIYF
jgi:hypothetical protein